MMGNQPINDQAVHPLVDLVKCFGDVLMGWTECGNGNENFDKFTGMNLSPSGWKQSASL